MPLNPEQVQSLFLRLVELPDDSARNAALAEACGDDVELKARVEALLRAHGSVSGFLETRPHDRPPEATASHRGTSASGDLIAGKYRLLQPIGEGGMGTVWMVEQRQPVKRLAALKLIKPGLDSRDVLARFEAERQALALMDHPNIARVFDGGTTEDQRPYFVMELVKGIPMTEYCDERRLGVEARLELFAQVCSAVQHAHQKGIIHRDLKPTNILVTEHDGRPVSKVIDFGLAKALHSPQLLTERTLHTAYGTVVGTPLYMAPEQVGINALDVDTRTDIYSLGVLLYELLTGTTPLEKKRFKEAAWDEIRRLIREEEPPKPSTRLSSSNALPSIAAQRGIEPAKLGRIVRGDLDWIVMKCLEKERNRRYESANQLADDLRRYLADEPVVAGPPSVSYRVRKFLRRHRGGVIVASMLLTALVAGVIGTTLGLIEAHRARASAETNERKAKEAAENERAARKSAESNQQKALDFARKSEEFAAKEQKSRQVAEQLAEGMRRLAESEGEARVLVEKREKEARWHLYKAQMFPLLAAKDASKFGLMEKLLADMAPKAGEPDFRGWEWNYLEDQARSATLALVGSGRYTGVGDATTNGVVAAATDVHAVDLWNLDKKQLLRTLPAQKGRTIRRLVFDRSGSKLATVHGKWCGIWDCDAGKIVCEFEIELPWIETLAWSPKGEWIVVGHNGSEIALIVDAKDGKVSKRIDLKSGSTNALGIYGLDWHPQGKRIAFGLRYGRIAVLDLETNRCEYAGGSPDGTPAFIVRWSPDGKRLAASQGSFNAIYSMKKVDTAEAPLKDWTFNMIKTGVGETSGEFRMQSFRWKSDSYTFLAGGEDQTVRIFMYAGERGATSRTHAGPVGMVAWLQDESTHVSLSAASGLRIPSTTRFRQVNAKEITNVFDLRWHPDGRRIAVAGIAPSSWVIDAEKGELVKVLPFGDSRAIRWFPNSDEVVVVNWGLPSRAVSFDATTGEKKRQWMLNQEEVGGNQSLDFTPDGKWLLAGHSQRSNYPFLFEVSDGKAIPAPTNTRRIHIMAMSRDGTKVAAAGWDGLRIWEVPSLKVLLDRKEIKDQTAIAWSHDGTVLGMGMQDGTIRFHRASDGKKVADARNHTGPIVRIQWAPDGHRIASACGDNSVVIWDSVTFDAVTPPLVFHKASHSLRAMDWSPDARHLALGYERGPIVIVGSTQMAPLPKHVDHVLRPGENR